MWRVVSKPGQAPPPSTGTAAGPSGTLHTCGAGSADGWLAALSRCPADYWCCLWPHGCFGCRRARSPAMLGGLTSFGAAPRSPPVPSGPSGTLHTSGAGVLVCGLARRLVVRPGPATASSISHAIPSDVFHGLKCDRWNSADSALVWGRAELELHSELREFPCPWSSLLLRGIALHRRAMHCLVASAMLCYLVHWCCI